MHVLSKSQTRQNVVEGIANKDCCLSMDETTDSVFGRVAAIVIGTLDAAHPKEQISFLWDFV